MSVEHIKKVALERVKATRAAIRTRREWMGFTQDELAERVGLDRFAIMRIENGRRVLYMSELCHIAAALGVDPIELMRGEVA